MKNELIEQLIARHNDPEISETAKAAIREELKYHGVELLECVEAPATGGTRIKVFHEGNVYRVISRTARYITIADERGRDAWDRLFKQRVSVTKAGLKQSSMQAGYAAMFQEV